MTSITPYLINENDRPLKEPPNPAVLMELVIDFGPASIAEVTGN
jgi:hypothetical protein